MILFIIFVSTFCVISGQEPVVLLNQGAVIGVKIFPESSRVPINAFLGVPYAAPPVGRLRFAAPEKHKGWKRTLYAQDFGPPCVQQGLERHSEDCLYLNIWVPDKSNRLPVVLMLGVDRLPAQDLASEGIVVVSASFRLQALGFLCLGDSSARGNLGILDQYLAMLWIRENISKFGGDPQKVTLMGYGNAAISVIYHMASSRSKALFSRAIIMSARLSSLYSKSNIIQASYVLARNVGCTSEYAKEIVHCLREVSSEQILNIFLIQYQNKNWTDFIMPIVDTFLNKNDQYLPIGPIEALNTGNYHQIPILAGITTSEAEDSGKWESEARQGFKHLLHYFEHNVIPDILKSYKITSGPGMQYIRELIKWKYINNVPDTDTWKLLDQLHRIYSDAYHLAPHYNTLKLLMKSTQPIYAYEFIETGNIDYKGKISNTSGAAHGSDLPFLFGPTLFQQLTRRRLTQQEERISKRMRIMWSEFIKQGYPIAPRQFEVWRPYTMREQFIYKIGSSAYGNDYLRLSESQLYWTDLIPRLKNVSDKIANEEFEYVKFENESREADSIRQAMYALLGLVIALIALLIICIVFLKRAMSRRNSSSHTPVF